MTERRDQTESEADRAPRRARQILRLVIIVAIVGAAVAGMIFLPVKDYLISLLNWTASLGTYGPIFVAAFYIVACVLFLPGSVLTLGAGFLFGVVTGTITVSIGSTVGACAAFLVGRTVARGWVAGKVEGDTKFAAIDQAVGREAFKIVLLSRLSPIFPFNMLNYAFSLTKVPFWKYALASWIGMIPGTIMYVYIGNGLRELTKEAAEQASQGAGAKIMFWAGLAVAVVVVVVVTRIARRALKQAIAATQKDDGQGEGGS